MRNREPQPGQLSPFGSSRVSNSLPHSAQRKLRASDTVFSVIPFISPSFLREKAGSLSIFRYFAIRRIIPSLAPFVNTNVSVSLLQSYSLIK
jgi:hypothetical protein